MSILPKNEKKQPVDTPSNFFIYGASMHGKSYLSGEFPNPLFLDTDGNSDANPYPSIHLRNIRGGDGSISQNVVDQLDEIVTALQTTNHTYETIVLDVIDDIVVMIEQYICDRAGVESLPDMAYGKGYATFNNIFQQLVIELKALPLNVIYVSRINSYDDNGVTVEEPSLKEKHVNIVNGNCDYRIQCTKVGKNYLRITKLKRKNYKHEEIGDERIAKILESVTGAFEKTRKTDKKKQDQLVKEMDERQEQIALGEQNKDNANKTSINNSNTNNNNTNNNNPTKTKPSASRVAPRVKPNVN